jgi:hypothetical protein
MSFSLEFYSLSWDALKAALARREPQLSGTAGEERWSRLLADTDLGQPEHHVLWDKANPLAGRGERVSADAFDEIAEAMARKPTPGHAPVAIGDNAALVFAAAVRRLGKPIGAINHDGSVFRDEGGVLPIDFRAMFLDGVAGASFQDHMLGERLCARPLFGLFHLDFVSWGGLTRPEIDALLSKYAPPTLEERQDDEYLAVAAYAEGWLDSLVTALRAAAAEKTDLVTLHLMVQKHYTSHRDEIKDELDEDIPSFANWLFRRRLFRKR